MKRILFIFSLVLSVPAFGAVVSRSAPVAVSSPSRSGNSSTMMRMSVVSPVVTDVIVETPAPIEIPSEPSASAIPDKSESFMKIFGVSGGTNYSGENNALRDTIRRQMDAMNTAENTDNSSAAATSVSVGGANACDDSMRNCMEKKCSKDFVDCAGDTDTIFGDKLESCKRDVKCSNDEYQASISQIRADRDFAQTFGAFDSVRKCGIEYNDCIVKNCGDKFSGCISKSDGDRVVSDCQSIEKKCMNTDSGLASRAMEMFGGLRIQTEKNIIVWEDRLRELRKLMENECAKTGAMFDQRSLNCVYSVEIIDGSGALMGSKKLSTASTYDCNGDWFGIDLTTYKENAARLTSSQEGTSAAVLGAGLGTLGGATLNKAMSGDLSSKKNDEKTPDATKQAAADKPTDEIKPVAEETEFKEAKTAKQPEPKPQPFIGGSSQEPITEKK